MRCYVDILLNTSTANIKTWERDNGLYGGLSPLARGTLTKPGEPLPPLRFIPAGAGNSPDVLLYDEHYPVYPRWRGELRFKLNFWPVQHGLSPLARGTRFFRIVASASLRFIPAGAGNSDARRLESLRMAVYPRWRGELVDWASAVAARCGLSPLARGTL